MKNKIYESLGIAGLVFSALCIILFRTLFAVVPGLIGLVFTSCGICSRYEEVSFVGWAMAIGGTSLSIIYYLKPWF